MLLKAEDKAIRRKEVMELALGIRIRQKKDQDDGRNWVINSLLKIRSRTSSALGSKFLSIKRNLLSKPTSRKTTRKNSLH